MNTKRQTIWLVSMLSLMVVLSAYYLFTEDTNPSKTATGNKTQTETMVKDHATEVGQTQAGDIEITEVSGTTEDGLSQDQAATQEANSSDSTEPSSGAASKETITPEDQAVLDEAEAQGVMKRSTIEGLQMDRNENYQKEMERLLGIINDADNINGKELSQAYDEMSNLDDREQKITSLENELQAQFDSAVITQENDKFKVVVQSPKLEVKEAVGIMDKVMKELNVTQDKISVQYVSE